MKKEKWFFGWKNIKWLIKEFINIYSSRSSFFSKKRIESGIAFLIGQIGMIWFFALHVISMNTYDICMWAAVEFAIAGYIVNQIQRQQRYETNINQENENENKNNNQSVSVCPTCGQPYLR
jgi:hypothetical protein